MCSLCVAGGKADSDDSSLWGHMGGRTSPDCCEIFKGVLHSAYIVCYSFVLVNVLLLYVCSTEAVERKHTR